MSEGIYGVYQVLASYLKAAALPDEQACLGRTFAISRYDQANMNAERIVGRIEGLHMMMDPPGFSVASAALRARPSVINQLMCSGGSSGYCWQLLEYDAFTGVLRRSLVVEFTLLD